MRDCGGDVHLELALLRESQVSIACTGDRKELALTAIELANALERMGDAATAAVLRQQAEAYTGFAIEAHVPYTEMARRLACRNAAAHVDEAGTAEAEPHASCVECCHQAFNGLMREMDHVDALHRLVAIAQKELQAERGALFRWKEGDLVCV